MLLKSCYNAKPLAYYFYVKTKISIDFQICISVPLNVSELNTDCVKTGNKRAHSCKNLFSFKKIQIMSYDNVLRFSGIFVRSQVFSNFRFPKFQFFNRFPHTDQTKKLFMWEKGREDFNLVFEGCFHENWTDIKTVGDNFSSAFMEKIRPNNSQKTKTRK